MRAELANLNHCAVLFLSRTAVNLSWYDSMNLSNEICNPQHSKVDTWMKNMAYNEIWEITYAVYA